MQIHNDQGGKRHDATVAAMARTEGMGELQRTSAREFACKLREVGGFDPLSNSSWIHEHS